MSAAPLTHFWQRSGKRVPFNGVMQSESETCVFASVAGAFNHLTGNAPMTEADLLQDHANDGKPTPNFKTVPKYASVRDSTIEWNHMNTRKVTPTEQLVDQWLAARGLVITSLEIVPPYTAGRREWHMLTLIAKDGVKYQVWDPGRQNGFVTWNELDKIGLDLGDGHRMMPHEKRDMLFLRKK